MSFSSLRYTLVALLVIFMPLTGTAQSYPVKPIRLIVPVAPGGSMDITGRILAQKMSETLGQSVVVDNRPGGSGSIGSNMLAKAPPDGYTLMLAPASHTVNPSLFNKLPYDTIKDFTPIMLVVTLPMVLVAHPSAEIRSFSDFLAKAKAKRGDLAYGSSGTGSAAHLAGELVKLSAGIDLIHVPYKGGGPAVNDVVAGQIPLVFNSIPPLLAYIQTDRVIPLAITSAKRSQLLPNVPTFAESGFPAVEIVEWGGLFAPAGTPKEVVDKVHAAVAAALRLPDVKEKLAGLGAEIVGSTPQEFTAFISTEIPRLAAVVKAAGIIVPERGP